MTGNKLIYECFSTLSVLASATRKIRRGSLVACNWYRNLSFLANIAVTIDAISGGRPEFGIGAGWDKEEYARRLIALRKHCDELGRRYDNVEKSLCARIKIANDR